MFCGLVGVMLVGVMVVVEGVCECLGVTLGGVMVVVDGVCGWVGVMLECDGCGGWCMWVGGIVVVYVKIGLLNKDSCDG